MNEADDKKLFDAVFGAIRLWTYDADKEDVAALKGEDGDTYALQTSLAQRVVAAVKKAQVEADAP